MNVDLTNCPMCQGPIASGQSEPAKTCSRCGADLTRWTRPRVAPPPLPVPDPAPTTSFPKRAASFCLLAPLISFGLILMSHEATQRSQSGFFVLASICTLFLAGGFILGIVALIGMREHGAEGILGKAIFGMCLNALFVFVLILSIPMYVGAAELARQARHLPSVPWDYKSDEFGFSITLPDSGWVEKPSPIRGFVGFVRQGYAMRADVFVFPCESETAFRTSSGSLRVRMDSAEGISDSAHEFGTNAAGHRYLYTHAIERNRKAPSGIQLGRSLVWVEDRKIAVMTCFQGESQDRSVTIQGVAPDVLETLAKSICLSIQ
jgi:hypothetical protein